MKGRVRFLLLYATALFAFVCLFRLFFLFGFVPSSSMEPTLKPGDVVLARKCDGGDIHRGDIVIFRFPDNPKESFVKRVIGLPGDAVVIENGQVFVNKQRLDEPYLKEAMKPAKKQSFCVPENSYFMLGDNRGDSHDSRFWNNPFVPEGYLLAKARVIVYPFSRFSSIP